METIKQGFHLPPIISNVMLMPLLKSFGIFFSYMGVLFRDKFTTYFVFRNIGIILSPYQYFYLYFFTCLSSVVLSKQFIITIKKMELSNRDKAEAIQNSIETETLAEVGLINPSSYKQHNPHVATGLQAILNLHEQMPMDKVYTNVVRKFQDGDFGFVHVDYFLFEPPVAFDIHRFE